MDGALRDAPPDSGADKTNGQLETMHLTDMHDWCISICMRTTLNLDPDLVGKAASLTGIREKTSLIHRGLEALIARESARRLAQLGGSQKRLRPIPRRRPGAA